MAAPYPQLEFTLSIGTWDVAGSGFPDTGFDGGIIIPIGVGREVVSSSTDALYRMPDGYVVEAPTWTGRIEIGGRTFVVGIAAIGNRYLIGREVLDQAEVCFLYGREIRLTFRE